MKHSSLACSFLACILACSRPDKPIKMLKRQADNAGVFNNTYPRNTAEDTSQAQVIKYVGYVGFPENRTHYFIANPKAENIVCHSDDHHYQVKIREGEHHYKKIWIQTESDKIEFCYTYEKGQVDLYLKKTYRDFGLKDFNSCAQFAETSDEENLGKVTILDTKGATVYEAGDTGRRRASDLDKVLSRLKQKTIEYKSSKPVEGNSPLAEYSFNITPEIDRVVLHGKSDYEVQVFNKWLKNLHLTVLAGKETRFCYSIVETEGKTAVIIWVREADGITPTEYILEKCEEDREPLEPAGRLGVNTDTSAPDGPLW